MSSSHLVCPHCRATLGTDTSSSDAPQYCDHCRAMVSLVMATSADLGHAHPSSQSPTITQATASPPPAMGTVSLQGGVKDETVDQGGNAPNPPQQGPLSEVPGFELLEVLGRGGMGVVYKARDLKLNRLVALKMILAGEHAGPEQVERFLAEARAVAKLQHPHIMQVYEIGEHKQLPYLALEFVAGGSLAQQWRRTKQNASDIAGLMETLARAVHVAHQQGIIHRDLKPANILLTADGTPKIGDFGLAKQLDEAGEQTRSGAVMGTPSYMAPEQAQGESRKVGPATDVYALGAIMYAGLTGHPPFQSDSAVDTLQKVINQEPISPSNEAAGLPRDLETICMKCLRKAPSERYASAEALAEDLRRFRQGEPIQARPVGWTERTWKWVRRRPAIAALILLTALFVPLALAVVVVRERTARQNQITQLMQDFESGLEAPAWDVAHRERMQSHLTLMETLLADLEHLNPQLAESARPRLHQRLVGVIDKAMALGNKAVLRQEDVAEFETMIKLVEARIPADAVKLRDKLNQRYAPPQLAMNLKAPFTEAKTFFPHQQHEATPQGWRLRSSGDAFDPVMLSKVPCTRNAELDVILQHDSWEFAGPIGLILNGGKDHGNQFFLRVAEPPEDADAPSVKRKPVTFAGALKRQGSARLQLYRNQLKLRQWDVPIAQLWPNGVASIRLQARRLEGRLTIQCNSARFEFVDAWPLLTKQVGVYGLYSTAPEVRISSLQAWFWDKAAVQSALERGDDLYAAGQFRDAQVEYHLQAQSSTDARIREEAQYKSASATWRKRTRTRPSNGFNTSSRKEGTNAGPCSRRVSSGH